VAAHILASFGTLEDTVGNVWRLALCHSSRFGRS